MNIVLYLEKKFQKSVNCMVNSRNFNYPISPYHALSNYIFFTYEYDVINTQTIHSTKRSMNVLEKHTFIDNNQLKFN